MLAGGKQILARLAEAKDSVELISPCVHGAAIEDALSRCPAKSKRLITRYRPFDILAGTMDLSLLARLRRKVDIRFLEDVHARVYIIDGHWAYVGSSLLTKTGVDDSTADLGIAVSDPVDLTRIHTQFAQLWSHAGGLTSAQWTLALHASDEALELTDRVRREFINAERALQRFVTIPRLRSGRPVPVPTQPGRQTPEFVRSRIEAWTGTAQGAHEVADLLAWAIEAIPNAAQSAAWTVLLGEHHLRLKLGLPEIVTIEEGEEGGALSVMGLSSRLGDADRDLLRKLHATVVPSPYASATGLSREAVRIGSLPLGRLAELRPMLQRGLAEYVRLHWSQAPTMAQRAFAPSVLEYLEDELDRPLPWPKDRVRAPAATGT